MGFPGRHRRRRLRRLAGLLALCTAAGAALVACGGSSGSGTAAQGGGTGGSLTVLEGPTEAMNGLDPGDETQLTYKGVLDAIYGELFELGANGQEIPDLASGYSWANGGKTLVIDVRKGVTFTDGTPFNAAAVAWNFDRDLKENCADCKPTFAISSITTPNAYTVDINMPVVFAAALAAFQADSFNFIASPTALAKEGETRFSQDPVGAGPFTVKSYETGTVLTLAKNPHYWQPGRPYLDTLIFKSVSDDETAYEALESGAADAYEDMNTPSLVSQFKQGGYTVTEEPSTAPQVILLNTTRPPFNNILAREAIYYATDAAVIDKELFGDTFPVTESFLAPGGLFYTGDIPGYRSYNLAKAKSLVQQLGGLNPTFYFYEGTLSQHLAEALQTEWQAAGMHVKLDALDLTQDIQVSETGTWQAEMTATGSFDPSVSGGLPLFFTPTNPQAGVHDQTLFSMMNAAAATTDTAVRQQDFLKIAEYLSDKAYGPFLFPIDEFQIAAKGVTGPGLTTQLPSVITTEVLWEDVRVS